jgi:hypothetical protein
MDSIVIKVCYVIENDLIKLVNNYLRVHTYFMNQMDLNSSSKAFCTMRVLDLHEQHPIQEPIC